MSVADFYAEVMAELDELGLHTPIWHMPVEIEGAIPFDEDTNHASYDPGRHEPLLANAGAARTGVPRSSASRFVGKASPVHFFWGGFDLAVTRFSGRPAPPFPGQHRTAGHTSCARRTPTRSAAAATGRTAGPEGSSTPTRIPSRRASATRRCTRSARYSDELGEFVLPYER